MYKRYRCGNWSGPINKKFNQIYFPVFLIIFFVVLSCIFAISAEKTRLIASVGAICFIASYWPLFYIFFGVIITDEDGFVLKSFLPVKLFRNQDVKLFWNEINELTTKSTWFTYPKVCFITKKKGKKICISALFFWDLNFEAEIRAKAIEKNKVCSNNQTK